VSEPVEKALAQAVAEGGAYEVIRKRLCQQGRVLEDKARRLNEARLAEFGASELRLVDRIRVRTENHCIARDMVQVGDWLLFGYNVFIGLKREAQVGDVFALFRLSRDENGYVMAPHPLAGTFLDDPGFVKDFTELYRYYRHAHLVELTVRDGKLLAGFQIGERLEDIRVLRWALGAGGREVRYLDNRGERDLQLPPRYDFEWVQATRDDIVQGRHPHVNVLDTVFVETVGGDLTVKVENNTEDGLGIYREPVEDDTQSLDDADIHYARLGQLILLKIRPYREKVWRYLVYNPLTQDVLRLDAIGESCLQLPEDHGIIFPGGYYLQSGQYKTFERSIEGMRFRRQIRSPNGEDVLYEFYEPNEGIAGLFPYNLIEKTLRTPIIGHGYALADDGTLVIFQAEAEPTRVHPMQIWATPYVSAEFASQFQAGQSFLGRIGNAELVRAISDLYSLSRLIADEAVSARHYEALGVAAVRVLDSYPWLAEAEADGIAAAVRDIAATAEQVIDEFDKVTQIRAQAAHALAEAEAEQQAIERLSQPEPGWNAGDYADALERIRRQRGRLEALKAWRYIDLERLTQLDENLEALQARLSGQTATFLGREDALAPYLERISELERRIEAAKTTVALEPLIETLDTLASNLDLLSERVAALDIEEAMVQTRILDSIAEVYACLNQCRAAAGHHRRTLGSVEAAARFGAQFRLFSQNVTRALGLATTSERCDEQLSRLLVQLEELEGQFGEHETFLADLMAKREEIYEAFESRKQQLLDARQRQAQAFFEAATRVLDSIERRIARLDSGEALNAYFASDPLVAKIHGQIARLRELEQAVLADDLEARFQAVREQAQRALRDRSDLYEAGGAIIRLGKHRFSVNTQALDLTLLPRDDALYLHLTGTDYFEALDDPRLEAAKPFWNLTVESETPEVYRAEFLACRILETARRGEDGLDQNRLMRALMDESELLDVVRTFAAPRYQEGYVKGIHDHDAARILQVLVPALETVGELRFPPRCRALAQTFWANGGQVDWKSWIPRAQAAARLRQVLASHGALALLTEEVAQAIGQFLERCPLDGIEVIDLRQAAEYLVAEMSRERLEFVVSRYVLKEELINTTHSLILRKVMHSG